MLNDMILHLLDTEHFQETTQMCISKKLSPSYFLLKYTKHMPVVCYKYALLEIN